MGSNQNEERVGHKGLSKAPLQYQAKGEPINQHKRLATGNKTINDPHGVGPVSKENLVGNSGGKNY